ncbi:MAG: sec-independent protein translocase protein TatA [Rhodospirillaceae bacterium]|nr:MAG: sec-independent protein translocase protein TatA [Rhodospirillaceae bacterium]
MGSWSIGHWVIVLLVILILFGAGKIPRLMGDMAKGVKAFKKGMKEDDETGSAPSAPVESVKVLEEQTARTSEVSKDWTAHG